MIKSYKAKSPTNQMSKNKTKKNTQKDFKNN